MSFLITMNSIVSNEIFSSNLNASDQELPEKMCDFNRITVSITQNINKNNLHTLVVSITYILDLLESVEPIFYTDNTPPEISLEGVTNNSIVQVNSEINVIITDSSEIVDAQYRWDSFSYANLIAPYKVTVPSDIGAHLLNIYAEDEVGNSALVLYVLTIVENTSETGNSLIISLISLVSVTIVVLLNKNKK